MRVNQQRTYEWSLFKCIVKSFVGCDMALFLCRVLVVCVGDAVVPSHGTEDGWLSFVLPELDILSPTLNNIMTEIHLSIFSKTLLVQFSNKQSEEQKSKYYIPVCLKKVLCVTIVETTIKICLFIFSVCRYSFTILLSFFMIILPLSSHIKIMSK